MSHQFSTEPSANPRRAYSARTRAVVLALLGLLIAFHLVNNWLWRDSNVIVFSMDRMFHQVTSLAYDDILREGVSLHTLFSALTWSDYYPPLVHLTVAAFYGIFGVSMDVAAMANSLYLVVLLLAVYSLGERLAGPWVGLLSAFVVSTFPIVFSMSRYLYIDFALTAMVAVNICLLVRSEGFQHKAYTLLYGLSLGLGMLTKWTFIAFAAAPFLLVLFTSGAIPDAVRALRPTASSGACPACPEGTRGKRSDRKRLLAACLLGLGLTALWFVPNAEATAALPLGYALPILSWLLWSATWYFALAPSGRGSNLLAALGLGLSIASSWYLTKINAMDAVWLNAYGKPTGRSWGFLPYLEFLYREQLSPIYAVLALVAIVGLIWLRWRRTRNLRGMLALGTAGWVLVLWTLASFLIFSSQASIIHSRYIMPLLPPLGIAIALWLYRIRQHWIRALLIALVVALALVQFAALTFDALGNLQEDIPVFAKGLSIQLPASGRTDAGYWVAPEILAYIEEHSDRACPEQSDRACPEQSDRDPAQLGILVNTNQVNSKQFIYLVYSDYPHVRIAELATVGRAQPSYPRLFENDFILAIDPPPKYIRRPDTKATLERLLGTPDDTFHRAFDLVQSYSLPDDTQLLLYQRRLPRVEGAELLPYYEALMADLEKVAQPGDAVVAMPAEQVYSLARFGDGSLPIYPLPAETRPLVEDDLAILESLGDSHSRLWLVLGEPGESDPGGLLANVLADRFYRADDTWYGPLQLVLYAPGVDTEDASPLHASRATWEGGITLQGYRTAESPVPLGQIIRLDLVWQATQQATQTVKDRLKVFVHLLDGQGQVVSQRDSEPVAGTRPTTSWQPDEVIIDKYGLRLPAGLPPGEYRIVVGLYLPETGERLLACCPATDAVSLATVRVEGDAAHISVPDGN